MSTKWKRMLLRPIPHLLTDWVGLRIARVWSKRLIVELCERATDKLLDFLLEGMDLAFHLMKGFRRNIVGFEGRYLFRTAAGRVACGATFSNGEMEVHPEGIDDWDVRVTFKDPEALRSFLFSRDQDILNSVLKNEVETDGNQNYIYKFGFMVRDLSKRLGVA